MFVMTLASVLSAAGHYFILGAGLILLLSLILLAAVFVVTLFMHIHGKISVKIDQSSRKNRTVVFFQMPFYRYDIIDFDSEDDEEETDESEVDEGEAEVYYDEDEADEGVTNEGGADKEIAEEDSLDKYVCHVMITDEDIRFRTVKPKKHSSEYEIVIHDNETVQTDSVPAGELEDIDAAKGTDEIKESTVSEFEYGTVEAVECGTVSDEDVIECETVSEEDVIECETVSEENVIECETVSDEDVIECETVSDEETVSSDYEDSDEAGFGYDFDYENISEDFSESLEQIKRYVDLSDPFQFASDSISAAVDLSHIIVRFTGDLLLKTDVVELSADMIYGLSDPADTAVLYGGIHSFKASLYASFLHVEATSHSFKKRQKAKQLADVLKDDIFIVPDLSQKTIEGEADFGFSFWIPRLYIPVFRLLLNKKSRRVFRHYIYPYYIRHSYKMWKEERRKNKEEKKRTSGKENSEYSTPNSTASGV